MNARKSLPPPDTSPVRAAMRRRFPQEDQETPVTEAPAKEASTDDVTTSRDQDATASGAHEADTSRGHEPAKPRRRDVTTSRRKRPAADEAVALTVRFDQGEYDELEEWMLGLRRELGRRKLDKSEVIRTLLETARSQARVRSALVKALGKG